jgi:hypothetical protein
VCQCEVIIHPARHWFLERVSKHDIFVVCPLRVKFERIKGILASVPALFNRARQDLKTVDPSCISAILIVAPFSCMPSLESENLLKQVSPFDAVRLLAVYTV